MKRFEVPVTFTVFLQDGVDSSAYAYQARDAVEHVLAQIREQGLTDGTGVLIAALGQPCERPEVALRRKGRKTAE